MTGRILELARRFHTARAPASSGSDAELLERFVATADGEAFGALVARHGPMVLGVCRRVLGSPHAAEDAFQATFLALARYAKKIHRPAATGAWLHGVARRAALRLRGAAARHETVPLAHDPLAPNPSDPLAHVSARELLTALDEELQRLPERYRLVIVHCYLEGRTVDETAVRLATSPGAVRGWLARARARLANQLESRGFSLPAALVALAVEVATDVPAVRASAAGVPPVIAAVADAAVGSGHRFTWAAVVCAGLAVGCATAGLMLAPTDLPIAPPVAAVPEPKAALRDEPPDALPAGALARLGNVRFKLSAPPLSVRYSPDGKHLAVGVARGTVQVFDARTGRVVREIRASQKDDVWPEAVPLYSPDGARLAVVTRGGRVGVWNAENSDAPAWALPPDDTGVRRLAFSPDGKLLAGGEEGDEPRVRVWDARTGKAHRALAAHPQNITGLAFSPDGARLATSCEDGGVRLFDVATSKEVQKFEHPGLRATAVAWVPDGKTLVSALTGARGDKAVNEVAFWDTGANREVARVETNGWVPELVFTPDGRHVLGSDSEGTRVWVPTTGKEVRYLRNVRGGQHPSLAVSADGKTLATPGRKEIVFHDLATGARAGVPPGPEQVSAVAFAPNGKTLAAGAPDGRVYLYDRVTGELRRELRGDGNAVTSVAFAPDGKTLAVTAGLSESVRIWDAASGEPVRTLTRPDKDGFGFASAVAYAPDGKRLAATSYGIVCLYDTATGEQVRRFVNKEFGKVNAIAFAPDGKWLAAAGEDRALRIWDTTTGEQVAAWHVRREIASVAFAPDGKRIAWGGGDGWCQVWEVPSGRTLARIKGHEYAVRSVAFTPDGTRVVTAGAFDTGPRVWDAGTGKELIGFRGHLDNPEVVAVAPDGKSAASGGNDGQVLIWDLAATGAGVEPIGAPPVRTAVAAVPEGAVRLGPAGSAGDRVAFSPDGKRLASTVLVPGSDAGLVVWDVATRKPVWRVEGDRDEIFALFWTANGETVAAACGSEGGTALVLWDAATGKELKRVRELPSACQYALSPDGKTLAARHPVISPASGAARYGGEIELFDVASGKRVRRLKGHEGDAVAWSPDGATLAAGSARVAERGTIRLWDPGTGDVVREWDCGRDGAWALAFLPDGTLTATGDGGALSVWNPGTGKSIRKVRGRGDLVVVPSADGTRFAAHAFDRPVVVRDVRTGRELGAYPAGPKWFGFDLSPDGKTLVTAGGGNLLLWPVPLRDGN
ncbi:(myosin heavy-chain) kinase : Uncultured bacterium genome assembly Metasoil_fosmids_resub OS=uncultured bacterium PE=4 SV=1: Sigma70_r2: Sigma70_r4_2: WD40: WD40: WD40: WD40: WD40: WD40: WD40: WD40 [Gemmata massiliana]|uniref:Uncharacterized protein n=1 Tax=Gemmata massiliana TaxID=1210884 RepID=A0A6P2D6Q1_9BACT|nr:sigma-70 family RNA polymerase sigma factor [Gemmata massiliana]VTR96683.1 (myosin heavy-chain) kinase : Uncultured bacterium genome assembly Metasoil_fosmids_resub OS=uncultured bacterium PE=4 SV=1: Sigma70_r2: Sigma70_r4_2: WD40: WD40: WD40: WD40: WD40: WD40: WD40: WD40 [Gemmata massiliana]